MTRLCGNCDSDRHARCCQWCGRTMRRRQITRYGQWCTRKCGRADDEWSRKSKEAQDELDADWLASVNPARDVEADDEEE